MSKINNNNSNNNNQQPPINLLPANLQGRDIIMEGSVEDVCEDTTNLIVVENIKKALNWLDKSTGRHIVYYEAQIRGHRKSYWINRTDFVDQNANLLLTFWERCLQHKFITPNFSSTHYKTLFDEKLLVSPNPISKKNFNANPDNVVTDSSNDSDSSYNPSSKRTSIANKRKKIKNNNNNTISATELNNNSNNNQIISHNNNNNNNI